MNKLSFKLAVAAFLASVPATAFAQPSDGRIQIKLLGTAVLPDGKIDEVVSDRIGLPAQSQTKASDRVIPTLAVEYFLNDSISVETICCVTPHNVTGQGGIAGAKLISNAIILPATVTAKYHFNSGSAFKPYVGAGPAYFFIFGEKADDSARALGATRADLSDGLGVALQAGVDVALNERGLGLSVDAKRYFVGTTASFRSATTTLLETKHKLDPWVVSVGLGYRF